MPGMVAPPRMHIAAVPRLSLFEVRGNVEAGRSTVLWRDANGEVIGQANASIVDGLLQLDWIFRGPGECDSITGQTSFILQASNVMALTGDNYTKCPHCAQVVYRLLFHGGYWACSSCHGLFPRSELISHVARQSERFRYLDDLVGAGRPKNMQARTYQRLREERKYLEIEVGDDPITPRAAYAAAISTRWFAALPWMEAGTTLHESEMTGSNDDGGLILTGEPLFSGESLHTHLQLRLQQQVDSRYFQLAATRRRVSGLQVRRTVTMIEVPAPVAITPEAVIRVLGRLDDGRLYAEHRSTISGDHDLLGMTIEGEMPSPLPHATLEPGVLIIGVVFEQVERSVVPLLVQAQLEDIVSVLAAQRAVLHRFSTRYADHVREAVKARMPHLSRGVAS